MLNAIGIGIPFKMKPGGGAAAWSPSALFASSEVGVWYDPSDFDTMWKDTAGTTPVTAVDDLVARIDDKSGNGFHATQATEANRPVLKQDGNGNYYLEFDRVNDWIGVGFTAGTITSNMDFAYGVYRAAASVVSISESYISAGRFVAVAQNSSSSATQDNAGTPTYLVNGTSIGSGISRDTLYDNWPTATPTILQVDGADCSIWVGIGTGFYTTFNGIQRMYSFVARQAMNSGEWSELMSYVNGKTGAY